MKIWFLVAALAGGPISYQAWAGPGCEAHKKDMGNMCAMMIEGAQTEVKNNKEGVTITISSKDKETVKQIQDKAEKCKQVCVDEKDGKHLCPMRVEKAQAKVKNTKEGVIITISSKDKEAVKQIQEKAKKCKKNCAVKAEAEENSTKAVCPVMNVEIDKDKARKVVEYKGKKYYLCCSSCVRKFEKDPDKYAK
jgi:YHS domain-containing protein